MHKTPLRIKTETIRNSNTTFSLVHRLLSGIKDSYLLASG